MKKILKIPNLLSGAEQVSLLQEPNPYEKNHMEAIINYILWYGFDNPDAQLILASHPCKELPELQNYISLPYWSKDALEILYDRGIAEPPPTVLKEETFLKWLSHQMHFDRCNEQGYGRGRMLFQAEGAVLCPEASEAEQIKWFDNHDYAKIKAYRKKWQGKAIMRFFAEAPEESIFRYLRYHILDEQEQIALVLGSAIRNENAALWFYFSRYSAKPTVQEVLRLYDPAFYGYVLRNYYGDLHKYVQKYNERIWRELLMRNSKWLAEHPVSELPNLFPLLKP